MENARGSRIKIAHAPSKSAKVTNAVRAVLGDGRGGGIGVVQESPAWDKK